MDDFGEEAGTEPEAGEREVYDLDDAVSDEVDAYMGYEDEDESGNEQDEEHDDAEPDNEDSKKPKIKDEDEEEEDQEEDQKQQAPKKGNTRSEKRIRQLIQKSKDKEREIDDLRQKYTQNQQQVYQWQMQQQKQQAEYDKQIALIRADNERFQRQQEIQEEANLDPVEKLQREAARRSREATLAEINPQLEELKGQMQRAEQERQNAIKRQEHEARLKKYEDEAYSATNSLLEGLDSKQSSYFKEKLPGYVLNWAATNNILPNDAGKEFDLFAHKYVAARQAMRKKRNGSALNRSAKTPKSIPNKRPSAKGGKKIPSYAELQKQGYPDALAYLEAQDN